MGVAAIAALGYRLWDRGALEPGRGPAYQPWDEWRGREDDGERRPLRAAVLAASPHNTQPWLFEVSAGGIAVYADRTRHLGAFDPYRRELHLGVGCAIENLVRAARGLGMAPEVQPSAGRLEASPAERPELAGRIELHAGTAAADPLFAAIPLRRTDRGRYRSALVPAERLRHLEELASDETARVVFLTEAGARRELGELIVEATRRIIVDPEMSQASFHWMRTGRRDILAHRDGVTIETSGTSRLLTAAAKLAPDLGAGPTDRAWLSITRKVHTSAPVFGMVLVRDRLDMAQSIAAGRTWQRLHLAATAEGLAAQPLNQPIEMMDRSRMLERPDEFGPPLGRLAAAAGWEPTFVFRVGYPTREAPHSPRRPLSACIRDRTVAFAW